MIHMNRCSEIVPLRQNYRTITAGGESDSFLVFAVRLRRLCPFHHISSELPAVVWAAVSAAELFVPSFITSGIAYVASAWQSWCEVLNLRWAAVEEVRSLIKYE